MLMSIHGQGLQHVTSQQHPFVLQVVKAGMYRLRMVNNPQGVVVVTACATRAVYMLHKCAKGVAGR